MKRRHFIRNSLLTGTAFSMSPYLRAQQSSPDYPYPGTILTGTDFDLEVSEVKRAIAGKQTRQIVMNGQLPAPLLRWREGDEIHLRITNRLDVPTSIHWHGILLPWQMDGVPGVSYAGIMPGETFDYRFPLRQSGTYWYHSHSGLQEQLGHYGPIIIDPAGTDPVEYDREHVIVLSDWSFEEPERIFSKLKKHGDNYNFQRRTLADFFSDAKENGLASTIRDRAMWGRMRMNPTDFSDVTAATYTYLINGMSPDENWTALFQPGEKVRLRFINASAMTLFNVRIPGLPLTVVQNDGQNLQPVETDEFQIGVAETFDVIVSPPDGSARTIYCETSDMMGFARATLATRSGQEAAIPSLRHAPPLGMVDMGMDMDMDMDMDMSQDGMNMPGNSTMDSAAMDDSGMDHSTMDHNAMDHTAGETGAMNHAGMDHAEMDHAGMAMNASAGSAPGMDSMQAQQHNHPRGPGVVNVADNPVNRLHERPHGLGREPHRVLVYTDLKSLEANPDTRLPARELELHLTSNMERYMWSFDGLKFSEVREPITFDYDERLRLTMVNDTMMPHPIHLHGMFFELVNGQQNHKPRKHTLVIKPAEKVSVDITANEPGEWAFHCHLLYHMQAGMMRLVRVGEPGLQAASGGEHEHA